MHDLNHDSDPYPPPWYSGPPPKPSRAPVLTAYVDTEALDHACPNCHAPEGEFCRHPQEAGGKERKAPCPKRIALAARRIREHETQTREATP